MSVMYPYAVTCRVLAHPHDYHVYDLKTKYHDYKLIHPIQDKDKLIQRGTSKIVTTHQWPSNQHARPMTSDSA